MAGHHVDAVGQVGLDVGEHRSLARSHVADDGAGFQGRLDGLGDVAVNAKRRTQDHQVGIPGRLGGIEADAVGEAEFQGFIECFLGPGRNRYVPRQSFTAGDMGQGRSNQAGPDQRHAPEKRFVF